MTDETPTAAMPPPKKRKGGSKKGERRGGRKKGTKNKATAERELIARLERERDELRQAAQLAGIDPDVAKKAADTVDLMKEIGFKLTRMAATMAAIYAPRIGQMPDGRPFLASTEFDEVRFRNWLSLAIQGARDFASYESPKLSAVMVGGAVVETIEIIGGLPDEQDGGFKDAPADGRTIDLASDYPLQSGALGLGPAAGREEGAGGSAVLPPGASEAVPGPGQA